jgi:carbon-monoxide dehydrogenase small subunit
VNGAPLHPIQEAFKEAHGLQCGFCTPGMMLTAKALLERSPSPDDDEIRWELSGNICRCTGYMNIVKAVHQAAEAMAPADKARPDDFRSVAADRPGTTL